MSSRKSTEGLTKIKMKDFSYNSNRPAVSYRYYKSLICTGCLLPATCSILRYFIGMFFIEQLISYCFFRPTTNSDLLFISHCNF